MKDANALQSSAKPATSIFLLSVARRAKLSRRLKLKKGEAIQKLNTAKTYDASVRKAALPAPEVIFHDQILLMGICSILETFLTDVSLEFLVCFPGQLETKQFTLDALAKNGSTSALLRESAEKQISEISYNTFPEMLKCLQEVFHFKQPLNEQIVNEFNEIRCTRDVYVHGQGKANRLYLRKTGSFARVKIDEDLPLGKDYLSGAADKAELLVNEFFAGGPANYLNFDRLRAFKEMWEATFLNTVMPFDDAWENGGSVTVGGESIARPTDFALQWGWSSSEQALFDFFLGIFSPHSEHRKADTFEALGRFPPSTPEGQIIISWMDSPFWF